MSRMQYPRTQHQSHLANWCGTNHGIGSLMGKTFFNKIGRVVVSTSTKFPCSTPSLTTETSYFLEPACLGRLEVLNVLGYILKPAPLYTPPLYQAISVFDSFKNAESSSQHAWNPAFSSLSAQSLFSFVYLQLVAKHLQSLQVSSPGLGTPRSSSETNL